MILWSEETNLWLLTPAEFEQLPDGTELGCINDRTVIKGEGKVDQDTRYGHLAYGIVDPETHPLKELLLTFILRRK